jgi:uncharacterized protein (TIGR02270 family)
MELHLGEAAFLWTQRKQGLESFDITFPELESGDERRLLAHLDGLVLGGKPVATRLLLRALEEEDPESLAAATWALLASEDADWRPAVFERLISAPPELDAPLFGAVELSSRADMSEALERALPALPEARWARALAALRFRGMDTRRWLSGVGTGAPDGLRAEALRALRQQQGPGVSQAVLRGMADPATEVQAAALEMGLLLGLREAWAECRSRVEAREPVPRAALLALAVSGDRADLERLLARLSVPDLRDEALWALGTSGRVEAVDAALRLLDAEPDWLAVECCAVITGMPLAAPFLVAEQPPSEDEDDSLDTPEAPGMGSLPGPPWKPYKAVVEPVRRWWAEARRGFAPALRYLHGRPFSPDAFLVGLEEEPMRRRPARLFELEMRTAGALRVEPRAWATEQRRHLAAVSRLPRGALGSSSRQAGFLD